MAQYSSQNRNYAGTTHTNTNPGMRTAFHQRKYEESLKNQEYMYDSAAPAFDIPEIEIPEEIPATESRTNEERRERRTPDHRNGRRQDHRTVAEPVTRFNLAGFVLVLAAFAFLAIVMVHYVQAQTELAAKVKTVAADEVALTEIKSSNDELYSRTISSIDLDAIEEKAVNELNMSYASEGQIITYTANRNDYMRKVDSN